MCGENKINQNKDANPIKCKMILNNNKKSIIFIYDLFLFSNVVVVMVVQ